MSGAAMPLTTLQISRMSKLLDEALPLVEAARRRWLETLSPEHQDLSQALQGALLPGDRRTPDAAPLVDETHGDIAEEMVFDKRPEKALAEARLEPNKDVRTKALAIVYYSLGRKADSDAMLTEIETKHAADKAADIAFIYAFRGETERAFQWLNRASLQHDPTLFLIKGNIGVLPNIEREPRYHALLREMHLPD